jgi:CheY-like chemotaxis protein
VRFGTVVRECRLDCTKQSFQEYIEIGVYMHKLKILVIDDDPANLNVISHFLNKVGYEVHVASSGEKAILLFDQSFSFVITDMHLGFEKMNGNDIAQAVRGIKGNIVNILVYAPHNISPKKGLFSHVLEKPIRLNSLVAALSSSAKYT